MIEIKQILITTIIMVLFAGVVMADNDVSVSYVPDIEVGDVSGIIFIDVTNATDIGGGQFVFTFDPAIVEFVSAEGGTGFAWYNTVDDRNVNIGELKFYLVKEGDGLNGDINLGQVVVKGLVEGVSPLTLTDVMLADPHGSEEEITTTDSSIRVWHGGSNPRPEVFDMAVDHLIPDDSDGVALWGEEALLSVTVEDGPIASVVVDLTQVGGAVDTPMVYNDSNDKYEVSTNAVAGTLPAIYELPVTATGENGRVNDDETIPLEVMMNGDADDSNDVTGDDALLMIYDIIGIGGNVVHNPYVSDVSGDGDFDCRDVIVMVNHLYSPEGYTLR